METCAQIYSNLMRAALMIVSIIIMWFSWYLKPDDVLNG